MLDQIEDSFAAVDNITRTDGLTGLGERSQRLRLGHDLGGLPEGQKGLDGVHDLLVHAAVILRGGETQVGVKVGRKS